MRAAKAVSNAATNLGGGLNISVRRRMNMVDPLQLDMAACGEERIVTITVPS
jgi:hypothetical protein